MLNFGNEWICTSTPCMTYWHVVYLRTEANVTELI